MKHALSKELVQELLDYRNGRLYWRGPTVKVSCRDTASGGPNIQGYRLVLFPGSKRAYLEHRVIWLYHFGYMPKELDHIDRNRSNNKIENLREVTRRQNNYNKGPQQGASSRFKGVQWHANSKKWRAMISSDSKQRYLGLFECEVEAAQAYNMAAWEYHRDFAYYNSGGGPGIF